MLEFLFDMKGLELNNNLKRIPNIDVLEIDILLGLKTISILYDSLEIQHIKTTKQEPIDPSLHTTPFLDSIKNVQNSITTSIFKAQDAILETRKLLDKYYAFSKKEQTNLLEIVNKLSSNK